MGMMNDAAAQTSAPEEAEPAPPETAAPATEAPESAPESTGTGAPGEDVTQEAQPEPGAEGQDVQTPPTGEGEEPATPEEQAAYERAFRALNKIMYTDQKSSQSVFDMLQPEDKIGSVSRAAMMLVKSLDDKLDMPETIIAQITQDAVEQLCDLAERAKQMPLSEQEQQQAMGATWEGVMEIFGQPVEDMKQFAQVSQKDAQKGMPEVQSALNGQQPGSAERRRMPMQGA